IPRPRNAFMIFRSEYHQAKITTDVERDHRHISRIVGHLWNTMSDEDKAPYRLAAEKEKAEHQRKYPGYRFCPGTRTSKPVKRK
ncbi:high mobility group box domain-containing protein, partial [Lentinula raphanica]